MSIASQLFRWAGLGLALLGPVAAEPYRFTLDGRPRQPRIDHLDSLTQAGDVADFGDFAFVLGPPGDYQLVTHSQEPNRVYRVQAKSEQLLVAKVGREYRQGKFVPVNGLVGLTPAQAASLRGLAIFAWLPGLPQQLRELHPLEALGKSRQGHLFVVIVHGPAGQRLRTSQPVRLQEAQLAVSAQHLGRLRLHEMAAEVVQAGKMLQAAQILPTRGTALV